jgi:cytochrome c
MPASRSTCWAESNPGVIAVTEFVAANSRGLQLFRGEQNSALVWDETVFAEYIRDPRAKTPGPKMMFAGIKGEQEIRDLTAFLKPSGRDGKKAN